VEDPISEVRKTNDLTELEQTAPEGDKELDATGKKLGKERYAESAKL
jgi:hypothetical protein